MTNNVSQIPSTINRKFLDVGDRKPLEIVEFIGSAPGPTVSVIGGIHGDEEEGVLSVRRFIQSLTGQPLKGKVLCLAVANPGAYKVRHRFNPADDKDLARVFPGDKDGTITQRIAAKITEKVIAGADVIIDLHSAGQNCAMPLFCGFFELGNQYSEKCAKFAAAFGTPIVWAHTKTSEGRSLSAALELNVPAIYAECGGGGEVRLADTNAYVDGLLNILKSLEMLEGKITAPQKRTLITDDGGNTDQAIMAEISGVVVNHVSTNEIVCKGDLLCEIYTEEGSVMKSITAPFDGIVMLLRRTARTQTGDVIAMLAPEGVNW